MAGPSYKVIAFDATKAGILPTVVIQASHTDTTVRKKEAMQHSGAVPNTGAIKTVMAAPAANPVLKTIVIPGYSGPA